MPFVFQEFITMRGHSAQNSTKRQNSSGPGVGP